MVSASPLRQAPDCAHRCAATPGFERRAREGDRLLGRERTGEHGPRDVEGRSGGRREADKIHSARDDGYEASQRSPLFHIGGAQ
jgi:hypothetical protein